MKQRLFTPGPTPVPDAVRAAMARPMMHHRDPAFGVLLQRVRTNLAWVFGAASPDDVIVLSGSGTLAMEAAVVNCVGAKDTALYVDSGKFGARWGEILRAYGVHAVAIEVNPGEAVKAEQVAAALKQHPDAKALYVQACETSTGVSHPIAALAALCQARPDCLCIVDGITHVAIEPLPMTMWGVDVVLGATQKSFMMSAGLTLVAMGARAWQRCARATLPRYYLNLDREREAQARGHTAWTSAVSLLYGLDVSLDMMRAEGLEALYSRHRSLAQRCRSELLALGCTPFAEPASAGLTVVRPPEDLNATDIIRALQMQQGMRIGGGQDKLAGKLLRVAHMGDMDLHDVSLVVRALGETFSELRAHRG